MEEKQQRLDDIIRTERYFTATLLPLLLFQNDMEGLKQFCSLLDLKSAKRFKAVEAEQSLPRLSEYGRFEHYQILSEFHISRDLEHVGQIDKSVHEERRDAPDLIIIVGEELIVVEAKFFGKYDVKKIEDQLRSQRKQIAKITSQTKHGDYRHVLIVPEALSGNFDGAAVFTWGDIAELSASVSGEESYVTKRLRRAVERWRSFLSIKGEKYFDGVDDYYSIRTRCVDGEDILIGFEGGLSKLKGEPLKYLQERTWKWRKPANPTRINEFNWIAGKDWLEVISRLSQ